MKFFWFEVLLYVPDCSLPICIVLFFVWNLLQWSQSETPFLFYSFFAQFHLKCVSFCFGVFVFLWVWFISKWTIVVYLQTSFQRRWYLVKFCEFIQKWRQLVQYCTQLNTINHKLYIIAVNWQLWTQLH